MTEKDKNFIIKLAKRLKKDCKNYMGKNKKSVINYDLLLCALIFENHIFLSSLELKSFKKELKSTIKKFYKK